MSNPKTINQLILWATQELQQSSDTAKLDAKTLLRHITDYSDVDLILKINQKLGEDLVKSYRKLIYKRQQGTPVAYLTGQKEFWSLNFKVTPDTLIPRPETELLVETALSLIPENSDSYIADLGTGSGAIACAIASERPKVKIIATDQSEAALEIAKENTKALEITNVEFIKSDWFENLADQQFDLVVSNPPYVSAEDKNLTQGDVRFEPDLALTPGADGLKDLRQIIKQSMSHLKIGGYLLVEHGYDQEQAVQQLFNNTVKSEENVIPAEARIQKTMRNRKCYDQPAYKNIICFKDLNGQPRITYGQTA